MAQKLARVRGLLAVQVSGLEALELSFAFVTDDTEE